MASSESNNPMRSAVGADMYDEMFTDDIPPESGTGEPVGDIDPSQLSHKKPTSSQVQSYKDSREESEHPGVASAIDSASTKYSQAPSSSTTPQSSSANSYAQHMKDIRASEAVSAKSALHRYHASIRATKIRKAVASQSASVANRADVQSSDKPSYSVGDTQAASSQSSSTPQSIARDVHDYYSKQGIQESTKPSPQEKAERQAELDHLDAENEMAARMHYWNGDRDFGATQEKIRDFYQPSHPSKHRLNSFFTGIKRSIHSGLEDLADKAYQKVSHARHRVRTWLYSHHLTPANYQTATLRASNPMTSTIPFTGANKVSPLVKYRLNQYRAERYRQARMQAKQYDYMHPKSLKEAMPRFSSDQARQGAYLMFSQVLPANRADPKLAEQAQGMVYSSVHFTDKDLDLMQNLNDNRKDSLVDTQKQGAEYLSKHNLYIPTLSDALKNEKSHALMEAFGGQEVNPDKIKTLRDPNSQLNRDKQMVKRIDELSFKNTMGQSPKDLFKSMRGFVNKTQKSMDKPKRKHRDFIKHVNEHRHQRQQSHEKAPLKHTQDHGPEM